MITNEMIIKRIKEMLFEDGSQPLNNIRNLIETAIPCFWEYDEFHDKYNTSCNHAQQFIAGKVTENYNFCPYCGRKIEVK